MTSHTQRSLLFAFIGSISLCGLIGIYCLLVGNMSSLAGRVLGTTAVIGGASILGLASAIPWESRRWHPIGPLGCTTVFVAAVLLTGLIWITRSFQYEVFIKALAIACTLAVAIPHVGLLAMARLRKDYLWVRTSTVIVIGILATLIIVLVIFEGPESDAMIRIMGALGIADVCGSLAVPILHRVSRIREHEAIHSTVLQLQLTCPRCGLGQQLPAGRTQCTSCGLRLRIEIEEEHCAECGYVLYGNESGVCPECGNTLASQPKRA